MRALGILSATLFLAGCVHLDAKPMTFTCGELLTAHASTHQSTPLFTELQRDAHDECAPGAPGCRGAVPTAELRGPALASPDPLAKALDLWRSRTAPLTPTKADAQPGELPVLMLSGGGGWGAFGAGYLQALDRRDWAAVTGVSTGALQGIFIAAGDYDEMAKAYNIASGDELAESNGLVGLVFRGSELNIAPLRRKVLDYLLPEGGAESPLLRMLRPDAPDLSIAMVEARSGDLKVVRVTEMVRASLGRAEQRTPAELQRVGRCVAGVALASSSIPVRLTPVQIDGRTYVDGGVRSSVFDAEMGRQLAVYSARHLSGAQPRIYVVRNGPTVVFRDTDDAAKPGTPEVDARPDIKRVGLRGYSTIVNQNELMSIAGLRLNYPTGDIRVISADGFNAAMNPEPCGPRPKEMFQADFMRCLVKWGAYKARSGPEWIKLSKIGAESAAKGTDSN